MKQDNSDQSSADQSISFEPIGPSPTGLSTTVVESVLGESRIFAESDPPIEIKSSPISAAPGAISDRWQVLECIGRGGMGVVYKARHSVMNKIVAVKILDPILTAKPTNLKRFQQEAQAASSLSHPNVVTVYDCGVSPEGYAFMIMDYLNGRTLTDLIRQDGRLSPGGALPIFRQTCEALAHAHDNKVIHRDLKPSNIMLVEGPAGQPTVKIVDFGIAKLITDIQDDERQGLTQTGELFGSPLYMSPEQCRGQKLDSRTDIYSMGCLMYETLTGKAPFVGSNVLDTLRQHLEDDPQHFVTKDNLDLFLVRLEAITFRCLAKNPDDRYQTMSELAEDLKLAHEGSEKGWRSKALALKQLPALKRMRKIKVMMPAAVGISTVFAIVVTVVCIFAYAKYDGNNTQLKAAHQYDDKTLWSTVPNNFVAEKPDFLVRYRDQQFALPGAIYNGGTDGEDYANVLLDTAAFFQENGHWEEAIRDYNKALGTLSKLPVVKADVLIGAKYDLAKCYLRENKIALAEAVLTDTYQNLKVFTQIHVEACIEVVRLLESVYSEEGNFFMAQKQIAELQGIYNQMRKQRKFNSLERRIGEEKMKNELADLYRRKKEFVKAVSLYEEQEKVFEQLGYVDPIDHVKLLYGLGLSLAGAGDNAAAASKMEEALQFPELSKETALHSGIRADYRLALWKSNPLKALMVTLDSISAVKH